MAVNPGDGPRPFDVEPDADADAAIDALIEQSNAIAAGTGSGRRRIPYFEWLVIIVVGLGSALLLQAYVVQQFAVDGHSMDFTLHDGDRVLVNKLSYHLHDPRRGDVVVLKQFRGTSERDLIKRVIALPGETIQVEGCTVLIDGKALPEPYLDRDMVASGLCGSAQAPTTIKPGMVFVMGDNRGGSEDSRSFGPISDSLLVGRAFVVIWPVGDWRWL